MARGQDRGPRPTITDGVTRVPDDEAAYIAFLKHGPACVVCTAGRPCQVGDELRVAAQESAIVVLTAPPPGVVPVPGCKTLHLVDESGVHEMVRVEEGACSWCRRATDGLIVVGIFPQDSGPGWDILACSWCIRLHELLPLSDHPEGGWCTPMHRDRTSAVIPAAEP